ncbi:hypothetical protein BpHYR1_005444 [Brachionus plicatilis]|uniref:Uncharacterized protein n=1 Tax=Brachionus plicatilis TaxID=10195 RepID=A0A3M7RH85_BRAPC|nr:hypothetical protein BpHYR1_005444 [Brachionus plicatilis]
MLELNNSITLVVGLLNKNQTPLKRCNENGHICQRNACQNLGKKIRKNTINYYVVEDQHEILSQYHSVFVCLEADYENLSKFMKKKRLFLNEICYSERLISQSNFFMELKTSNPKPDFPKKKKLIPNQLTKMLFPSGLDFFNFIS